MDFEFECNNNWFIEPEYKDLTYALVYRPYFNEKNKNEIIEVLKENNIDYELRIIPIPGDNQKIVAVSYSVFKKYFPDINPKTRLHKKPQSIRLK